MIPSNLKYKIQIEKENTSTNRVGTPKETYTFLKECYAQKVFKGGTTQYSPYGEVAFSTDDFIIRHDERINYKCRVVYNNNYYKIEHIEEIGRNAWLKLKCIVWERDTIR